MSEVLHAMTARCGQRWTRQVKQRNTTASTYSPKARTCSPTALRSGTGLALRAPVIVLHTGHLKQSLGSRSWLYLNAARKIFICPSTQRCEHVEHIACIHLYLRVRGEQGSAARIMPSICENVRMRGNVDTTAVIAGHLLPDSCQLATSDLELVLERFLSAR